MNRKDDDERKTHLRISKSGRKYWWNPDAYERRIIKENQKREREGKKLLGKSNTEKTKPYCYDKDSPTYMRYWEKKQEIRNEYPKWVHMDRDDCREYYGRVWDLIQNDVDYQQWKEESKTLEERSKDEWWEERKRKDEEYDGRGDEYY